MLLVHYILSQGYSFNIFFSFFVEVLGLSSWSGFLGVGVFSGWGLGPMVGGLLGFLGLELSL